MKASNYYLLRLPTLPIFDETNEQIPAHEQLRRLWEETPLAEAIFVASPALYEQIQSHLRANGWPLLPAQRRTLWRYALRMSSRATPFGLMAGFSVGKLTGVSQVELAPYPLIRHQRLDMNCVAGLIRTLVHEPGIRNQVRFFPNNSRYAADQELRYTEWDDWGATRRYFLSAVTVTPYLTRVLQQAESGATPNELIDSLANATISRDEAAFFIDQLIDDHLLVSELEPALTGLPILPALRARLSQLADSGSIVDALTRAEQALDGARTDSRVVYQTVREALAPFSPDLSKQHLIQTDLQIHTATNQLNSRVIQAIVDQITRLKPLNRSRPNRHLTDFVRRFRERYEQREVALQTVLDGDFGIGYGDTAGGQAQYAALIDELLLPQPTQPAQLIWGPYENLLIAKLSQALQTGQQAVELTDEDLLPLSNTVLPAIPASFYVFGNLLGESCEALDRGDFRFSVLAVEGPSAATLLGRFCSHSPELTSAVHDSLQREEEQKPDAIYAEIVHWPDDRLGNILIRPRLRTHEIPYISQASADEAHQLPMSDLLVSVQADGRVLLRSKRYGKEVIPRLSTAHSYQSGLSTYRFLADLQYQDGHLHLGWDWSVLSDQPFLPRITYRNLILSRSRWNLAQPTLPMGSAAELIDYLKTHYQLPRWIAIADGDQELALDLETSAGQQLILEEVRRQSVTRLVEWVATPDQCWIQHQRGTYVNEVIIPCEITGTKLPAPAASPEETELTRQQTMHKTGNTIRPIDRSFGPGSEWLYVKLYSGAHIADDLLKTIVWPFIQELTAKNVVDPFFFIRYADPEPHLRLRLHNSVPNFAGPVLDRLNEWLLPYQRAGTLYRVQTDTYEREIERYGHGTMGDTEYLFGHDSWAVLRYLAQETDPSDRWLFALQSCEALLTDFGLDTGQKVNLLQRLQAQFLAEHQATPALRQQLNDRFRTERALIQHTLAPIGEPEPTEISLILTERSAALQPVVARIITAAGSTAPALLPLLASYLHMNLNRLFVSQQRTHEMVVYHFLARFYESQQARKAAH